MVYTYQNSPSSASFKYILRSSALTEFHLNDLKGLNMKGWMSLDLYTKNRPLMGLYSHVLLCNYSSDIVLL